MDNQLTVDTDDELADFILGKAACEEGLEHAEGNS